MPKEMIERYAPIALVIVSLIIQWNIFATPVDVETRHRLIMVEMAERYVTKEEFKTQKEEFRDMKIKIDKIYDYIMTKRGV